MLRPRITPATHISRDTDAAACGHGAIHRRFGHDARRGGYRQSGNDGVVVHRPIGVMTWAQLASEEIVLLVVGSYENRINHGRGFRPNRPTMAAAHTDPRSTMRHQIHLVVPWCGLSFNAMVSAGVQNDHRRRRQSARQAQRLQSKHGQREVLRSSDAVRG
uniref:Uncharacterized protein n=1 Tax=Oryza sativa subsp. japonica TaxID=39947 RepID=Q6K5E1_ORYSJ|nr:hypothetical protein [Oryza sativa Japonica Group]